MSSLMCTYDLIRNCVMKNKAKMFTLAIATKLSQDLYENTLVISHNNPWYVKRKLQIKVNSVCAYVKYSLLNSENHLL